MARLGRVWNTFRRYKSLKYIVVVLLGVLLVGFLDENSVWNHFNNRRQIGELREEIARQRARYEADRRQIRLLDTDPKTIEKIARERYFMKAEDEDIFVLSDDKRKSQPTENGPTE